MKNLSHHPILSRKKSRYNPNFIWPEKGSTTWQLLQCTDPEVIAGGPFEAAKTLPCLMKLHIMCCHYPIHALIVRKVKESLKASVMRSYEDKVLPFDPRASGSYVNPYGGLNPSWYDYKSGARIMLGGLNKPETFLSAEFDIIYVNQCEEVTLEEWSVLKGRATGRAGNIPYGQIYGDCNPGSPRHWIKQKWDNEELTYFKFIHKDNPMMYRDGKWTPYGEEARKRLQSLPGLLYERGYLGNWVAAEGQVYQFDEKRHLIKPIEIQRHWRKFCAIDYGTEAPFVCLWFAITDDGTLIKYREIYMTNRLVEDHAEQIKALSAGEIISYYITDHGAQENLILEKCGIAPTLADKEVLVGVEMVKRRLRDDKLLFIDLPPVEIDQSRVDNGKPTCTVEEFGSYSYKPLDKHRGHWSDDAPAPRQEDHGMDAMRYGVVSVDNVLDLGILAERVNAPTYDSPYFK